MKLVGANLLLSGDSLMNNKVTREQSQPRMERSSFLMRLLEPLDSGGLGLPQALLVL